MVTLEPHKPRRGTVPSGTTTTRYALSIDPGVDTGWALWSWPLCQLISAGIGHPPVELAYRLAVEKPQVYPQSPVPPNDLITLAMKAGRYVGAFEGATAPPSLLLETITVLPHEWKGNIPKDICEARIRRALTIPELHVATSAELEVPKSLRNNMWDAIGIGLFVWRKVRL